MPTPFQRHIRTALQNANLQLALDGNAERRHRARLEAYAALDADVEDLRRRAHAVRAETLAHLERYLDEFTANAEANGMVVHRAADAAEALATVLALVEGAGARRVVKSKTMVGEEIEINAALERAGCRVVETDLGEWIVQMRGERPGHLLTPAVHLRRQDVGRLFADKLGLPYTEDVPALVAAARRALRQEFLEADVGISGVNFGVASEGALCLLTNEGNGRMATTLPRLHIALMGIERLAPNLGDLALLLQLLPRAASGQKMTVYANLIRGPRQAGEVDGASERHVVLVDNGRRRLRASPLVEALYCIRCGACLNECPVFRELSGHHYVGKDGQPTPYSGPIGAVISPGLFGWEEFSQLARASSLCGACQEACPVAIPLPELLLRVRAGVGRPAPETAAKPLPEPAEQAPEKDNAPPLLRLGLRIFSWLARSPGRFRLAQRLLGGLAALAAPRRAWLRLPKFTGWGLSRDFPRPEKRLPLTQSVAPELPAPSRRAGAEAAAGEPMAHRVDAPQPRLERFRRALQANGGVFLPATRAGLGAQVLALLQERGARRVLAWEPAFLPAGLADSLTAAGIELVHQGDAQAALGLTGALAAAADTGTLLLSSGTGRPLTASLLPETHIAILAAGAIKQNLLELLALPEARQAAATVLISGPSRTADIEMTLTIGVHGPAQVIVLCVLDG